MSTAPAIDPLLKLASTIATHLAARSPPPEDLKAPLALLRRSAQQAAPREDTRGSSRYATLIEACSRLARGTAVGRIATDLLEVQARLPWVYHYTPRNAAEDLADRIAFAELIGPDGPLLAPDVRVGFTLMAPETSYPLHVHPAVELYLVIAGRACWITPTTKHIAPPDTLILHSASEPHAMRTFDEPLLALWGWSGEIDAPAAYL